MHGKLGGSPSPPHSPTEGSGGSPSKSKSHRGFSVRKMGHHGGKKPSTDPMDWGMPGHLTEDEVAIFVSE